MLGTTKFSQMHLLGPGQILRGEFTETGSYFIPTNKYQFQQVGAVEMSRNILSTEN